jgi:hypothetical protein
MVYINIVLVKGQHLYSHWWNLKLKNLIKKIDDL